ncbi:MAG: N-acetyltransferase [Anaerolineales bacterium]
MSTRDIHIEPVKTRRELRDLIKFPFDLYRDDPYWVPPLIRERMAHYDPERNPFFEHAEAQFFRALRGNETVGTIAAIDDELHPKVWNEPVGFWGVFEVIEDYEVAARLFSAAQEWLASRGREIMRGPLNLNINDEIGLLIEGYDGSPAIMMPYNPPYYKAFVERYGFQKAKDLYAYRTDIARYRDGLPESIERGARIAEERYNVTVRPAQMEHLEREVELIKPVYRQAWSENWGALPMTDEEFDYLAEALKVVVDPDLTILAFLNDEPVGVMITLADYHQVLKHLNGRLLPFGWLKFLWYKHKIEGIRVLVMGVLKEHRLKGIEGLMFHEAYRESLKKDYEWVEMSWILEDNYRIIRTLETIFGEIDRTYRLYDLPIAGSN